MYIKYIYINFFTVWSSSSFRHLIEFDFLSLWNLPIDGTEALGTNVGSFSKPLVQWPKKRDKENFLWGRFFERGHHPEISVIILYIIKKKHCGKNTSVSRFCQSPVLKNNLPAWDRRNGKWLSKCWIHLNENVQNDFLLQLYTTYNYNYF